MYICMNILPCHHHRTVTLCLTIQSKLNFRDMILLSINIQMQINLSPSLSLYNYIYVQSFKNLNSIISCEKSLQTKTNQITNLRNVSFLNNHKDFGLPVRRQMQTAPHHLDLEVICYYEATEHLKKNGVGI